MRSGRTSFFVVEQCWVLPTAVAQSSKSECSVSVVQKLHDWRRQRVDDATVAMVLELLKAAVHGLEALYRVIWPLGHVSKEGQTGSGSGKRAPTLRMSTSAEKLQMFEH